MMGSTGLQNSNRFSHQLGLKNVATARLFRAFEKGENQMKEELKRPKSSKDVQKPTPMVRERRVQSATIRGDPICNSSKQHDNFHHRAMHLNRVSCYENCVDNGDMLRVLKSKELSNNPLSSSATAAVTVPIQMHDIRQSGTPTVMPSTLTPLKPYISNELPSCIDHSALRGSIVLLPGLSTAYDDHLSRLPAPHRTEDDYPFTNVVQDAHIHKPKKYSHPYYERMKKIKGWSCHHTGREVRVNSSTGEIIHRHTINSRRNKDEIRDEIVELERLIKGLSTDWSRSSVVLYQNEINNLQKMVKSTLSLIEPLESPPPTPDPTGLRKFYKEYDTALQALRDRHKHCMLELYKIEEMESLYKRAQAIT